MGHSTFPGWHSWHLFIEHPSSCWERDKKKSDLTSNSGVCFWYLGQRRGQNFFKFFFAFSNQERWTHNRTICQVHYLSFINLIIENEKQLSMLFMLKHNLQLKISRLSFFNSSVDSLLSDVNRIFNCLRTGKLGTKYCVLNVEVRIKTTLWFFSQMFSSKLMSTQH